MANDFLGISKGHFFCTVFKDCSNFAVYVLRLLNISSVFLQHPTWIVNYYIKKFVKKSQYSKQTLELKCQNILSSQAFVLITGKSMSEALSFALTNPQYYKRLFMKIANGKLRTSGEQVVYINCLFFFVLTFRTTFIHNMFS